MTHRLHLTIGDTSLCGKPAGALPATTRIALAWVSSPRACDGCMRAFRRLTHVQGRKRPGLALCGLPVPRGAGGTPAPGDPTLVYPLAPEGKAPTCQVCAAKGRRRAPGSRS